MQSYDLERFIDKIQFTDTCWLWKASTNEKGYGQFRLDGVLWIAHRLSAYWFNMCFNFGLTVEHECRNVKCVNPDHLIQVTNRQNLYLRHNSSNEFCPNGHDRATWTIKRATNNAQRCTACNRIARRVYLRTGSQANYFSRALPHEKVL